VWKLQFASIGLASRGLDALRAFGDSVLGHERSEPATISGEGDDSDDYNDYDDNDEMVYTRESSSGVEIGDACEAGMVQTKENTSFVAYLGTVRQTCRGRQRSV
jgi:hypothetical protein